MGIDDEVARLHKVDADDDQRRRQYLDDTKATIPAYKAAFVDFYHALIKHRVPPSAIVELSETIPGQKFSAKVIGHAWRYSGVLIMPDGTFMHVPADEVDTGLGDWSGRGRAIERAFQEAGIDGPGVIVEPGYRFVEVDWAKSLEPVFPSWGYEGFLVVRGLGMTLASSRNDAGVMSPPGLLESESYSTSPLSSVFAHWIYKAQQPDPAPAPEPPAPEPPPRFVEPARRVPTRWDEPKPKEQKVSPTQRGKQIVLGLLFGLLGGALVGLVFSVMVSLAGGGIAGPITAVACLAVGSLVGLLLGVFG
ncbi:hypothetical protein ACLH0K_08830 [Arthrobacter sp. MPF02]|uniref:hypothetical protein n=1 Tax=Arthrobacter sp. MPF02 TaxID=3388492 RepID=UPI0039855C30